MKQKSKKREELQLSKVFETYFLLIFVFLPFHTLDDDCLSDFHCSEVSKMMICWLARMGNFFECSINNINDQWDFGEKLEKVFSRLALVDDL